MVARVVVVVVVVRVDLRVVVVVVVVVAGGLVAPPHSPLKFKLASSRELASLEHAGGGVGAGGASPADGHARKERLTRV